MYQFSRAIFRAVEPDIHAAPSGFDRAQIHLKVLQACEYAVERLATDAHFADPPRWLFREIRQHFLIQHQARVRRVIELHLELAHRHFTHMPRVGLDPAGNPLVCHALTRSGTPCQREPVPPSLYCPSHKHLDETVPQHDVLAAA